MAADPSNIKQIEYNGTNLEILQVSYVPEYDIIEYDFNDEKELKKYYDKVEKTVRNSFEYQEYIKYLREYMDMNKCSFFENVNNMETTKIKIHIHHSPITLYEIAVIVYEKRRSYGESLEFELVAKEVMYVHYCLLIGLIPLCETIHTLVHNEYIFIPNSNVMGKYNDFLRMYEPWVPWQIKEKLERIEQYSKVYDESLNRGILEPHYIYLDFQGTYKLPTMDSVLKLLQERMDFLRNNNYSMEIKQEQPVMNTGTSVITWHNK